MADDYAEELIPWHYSSAKLRADAELLREVKEQKDMDRRITARKGWVTRALDKIQLDQEYDSKFQLKGKEVYERYNDSKTYLEERMGMLVNAYRRQLQIIVFDKETYMSDFDAVLTKYQGGIDIIVKICIAANPTPVQTPTVGVQVPQKGLSKGTLDTLKPNNISENSLPHTLIDFSERLKIYMNANGILQLSFPEQRQIARSFMSTQLWNLIRDRITPAMPVFMNTDDENYIEDEENSVMELLQNEFRRLHPTITRRLALIKKSQRAEQSSLAFLSEVKRDALSANLRDVDEQALTCMILINGLSSEELRAELLDLFEVDEDLTLATIESGIRKYEANKKTSSYVQGRKSDLFQVSNYKRSQQRARRENAQKSMFCDKCKQKGHTISRCPLTKGQSGRGKGQAFQRRGRSQGRSSFNGGSRARSQSRNAGKSQGYSYGNKGQKGFKKGQKSHLRSMTQKDVCEENDDENCNVQEFDDNGKFVSYLNVLTCTSKPLLGLNHSLPTPRLPVTVQPILPKGKIGQDFKFKAIADSGATRSCLSEMLAKEWNVWYQDASHEVLLNASRQGMHLTGSTHLNVTFNGITVRVNCLITTDIQRPELILSWHDMSLLKLIKFDFDQDMEQMVRKMDNLHMQKVSKYGKNRFQVENDSVDKILADFSDVISDKLPKKPIKAPPMVIHIDPSKMPPKMPYVAPRARPAALDKAAKEDILQMERDGIIEKPKEPPVFLHHAMHVLKPNGDLRFIVDFSKGCNLVTI